MAHDVESAARASLDAWGAAVGAGRVERFASDHEIGFVDGVVWALQTAADDVFDTDLPAECATYLRNLAALALDGEW